MKHFYLAGGHRGLYPGYPKADTSHIILTESIIDAATLISTAALQDGSCVLALYGTNGWTEAIGQLHDLKEITLFFDGDEAGSKGVMKYGQLIKETYPGMKIATVTVPQGEDINSLLNGHESDILQHLIQERKEVIFSPEETPEIFSVEKTSDENKTIPNEEITPNGYLDTSNAELITYTAAIPDKNLQITLLGGMKLMGLDRLRVTLKITADKSPKSSQIILPLRYSLDLYQSRQVEQLVNKINEQFGLSTSHAGRLINELTTTLEQYRQRLSDQLKPKAPQVITLTESQRKESIQYLQAPELMANTMADLAGSGITGEQNNAMIAYLCYTSRKREKPLHVMYLGSSGTGKTYLQERVSALFPDEEKIEITTLSDNALYYFGREQLKHKIILIEDLDGAMNVLYPLRELQSKTRISKTVTLKDNKGNLKTVTLIVEGPVCVSGCTTKERLYEDNANRCILLYIDESAAQDKRVMDYQRDISGGVIDHKAQKQVIEKLQNVQRVLQPIDVVNPYAHLINLPPEVFKPRRTLSLLLNFIESITYYHQYQRPVTDGAIYTTKQDIEWAFTLLKDVLFSKSDELSKAGRSFLETIKNQVKTGEVFYSGTVRRQMRISSSAMHRYMGELVSNGYIRRKGGSKYKGFEYEITDYSEYDKLKDSIDQTFQKILDSIPLSHQYPGKHDGKHNDKNTSELG